MAEIRWILLGLGLVLIAGIWWRGARRSAQAPSGGELRQVAVTSPPVAPMPSRLSSTEWGVSPLEPLSIKTADFDRVPVLDMSLRVEVPAKPAPTEAPLRAAAPAQPAASAQAAAPQPVVQKIVTLRVCAPNSMRWSGTQLRAALESQQLVHGRYQVFHRKHTDGATVFCVASLVEPGSFDLALMPAQEFRGITAFAVLPGPLDALQTFDALVIAVRGLAEGLSGMAQDAAGLPLSPLRAAALREEVARFQAQQS